MVPELFEMSLKPITAIIFDAGKLKPEYIFKKIIHLFKIIHSKELEENRQKIKKREAKIWFPESPVWVKDP